MTEERKANLIQLLLSVAGSLTGAFIACGGLYLQIDDRFDTIELNQRLNSSDRWRGRDQQTWASQLQANNPGVLVPPVVLPEVE